MVVTARTAIEKGRILVIPRGLQFIGCQVPQMKRALDEGKMGLRREAKKEKSLRGLRFPTIHVA